MDSGSELDSLATSAISTRQDFVEFLNQLLIDYQKNREEWENQSIDDFLEALAAYANDIPSYYRNLSIEVDADSASWRVFADMLRGAIVYE